MKYKIGVYGSAEDVDSSVIERIKELGRILSEQKTIVITGACDGIPYLVAEEAFKHGAEIWGYAAQQDLKSITADYPHHNMSIYSELTYIPKDFPFSDDIQVCRKYRNVISTANCDAGIIISGRWGTMNEFTNLYDYGKVIGILSKTGGIADEIEDMMKTIKKKSAARVIFESSPGTLLAKILANL